MTRGSHRLALAMSVRFTAAAVVAHDQDLCQTDIPVARQVRTRKYFMQRLDLHALSAYIPNSSMGSAGSPLQSAHAVAAEG